MILFIDGSQERMALAYQRMPKHLRDDTIWASTPESAINVIKDYYKELSVISLDHNLTEFTRGDSRREDSGMEVVRFVEKFDHDKLKHVLFICHGWDERLNQKMADRLNKANYTAVVKKFGA